VRAPDVGSLTWPPLALGTLTQISLIYSPKGIFQFIHALEPASHFPLGVWKPQCRLKSTVNTAMALCRLLRTRTELIPCGLATLRNALRTVTLLKRAMRFESTWIPASVNRRIFKFLFLNDLATLRYSRTY
jgi:hypothetical protein